LSFCCLISWISSRITGTSSTLMPAVGSSNMKISGSSARRDRDLELPLVAVRELRRERGGRSLSVRARGNARRARSARRAGSTSRPGSAHPGARLHREAARFPARSGTEQVRQLERAAHSLARCDRRRAARNVLRRRAAPGPRSREAVPRSG
jgi:hypothetical protein